MFDRCVGLYFGLLVSLYAWDLPSTKCSSECRAMWLIFVEVIILILVNGCEWLVPDVWVGIINRFAIVHRGLWSVISSRLLQWSSGVVIGIWSCLLWPTQTVPNLSYNFNNHLPTYKLCYIHWAFLIQQGKLSILTCCTYKSAKITYFIYILLRICNKLYNSLCSSFDIRCLMMLYYCYYDRNMTVLCPGYELQTVTVFALR